MPSPSVVTPGNAWVARQIVLGCLTRLLFLAAGLWLAHEAVRRLLQWWNSRG
jgi:hypothetical protein